jgi:hypothetical protein
VLRDERDYIMRMIAAAAAAVAALRKRLVGGESAKDIIDAARAAQGDLLGKDVVLLRATDAVTAAMMTGPERLSAWADLLDVEADALRAAGQVAEANATTQRAAGIRSRANRPG